MALSPDKVHKTVDARVEKLEKYIDAKLKNYLFDPEDGHFVISLDDDPSNEIKQELVKRYLAAGWKRVTFSKGPGSFEEQTIYTLNFNLYDS